MATPPERPQQDDVERRDGTGLPGQAEEFQRNLRSSAHYAAASYTLIGGIVVLGGLGYFADDWFDTSPWLLLLGLLMGILVGFYELIRVVWGRGR